MNVCFKEGSGRLRTWQISNTTHLRGIMPTSNVLILFNLLIAFVITQVMVWRKTGPSVIWPVHVDLR